VNCEGKRSGGGKQRLEKRKGQGLRIEGLSELFDLFYWFNLFLK
jgi:hypothetical protein